MNLGEQTPKTPDMADFPALRRLAELLLASVSALAEAGKVEAACRLAGQAYVTLRGADPAAARRFDVLLHRLAPTLRW